MKNLKMSPDILIGQERIMLENGMEVNITDYVSIALSQLKDDSEAFDKLFMESYPTLEKLYKDDLLTLINKVLYINGEIYDPVNQRKELLPNPRNPWSDHYIRHINEMNSGNVETMVNVYYDVISYFNFVLFDDGLLIC